MRRVVSLFLPTWPTDRLRRQADAAAPPGDEPLVTAGSDGRRRAILAADAAAKRLGLHPGLALARARARVPGLHVAAADPVADGVALDRLALWCLRRYSPVAASDPPDGLLIDATGASHLFGGDAAMLTDMVDRLEKAAIAARAAMAGTVGAAHALARHGSARTVVIADGDMTAALAHLPVAALRLSSDTAAGLRALGFEGIGALERTPRAPLARRFGPEVVRRLDQAFGRQAEPFAPIMPPAVLCVRRTFVEPTAAPAVLERAIARLADALCAGLESRGLGARRLDLLFHRVDGAVQGVRAGTARPARDPRRLARLLADRLETVDPGFGVEHMTLTASLAEPLPYRQTAVHDGVEPQADLAPLIDSLANRLGAGRLFRAAPVASDLPERSVRFVPPLTPPTGESWPAALPRPARLLSPPEPVETMALLPDHPPVRFVWRGECRRVARADGPERVFGEWWQSAAESAAVRDYFQVEDEAGERFWLFRSGDGADPETGSFHWYIHGIFA